MSIAFAVLGLCGTTAAQAPAPDQGAPDLSLGSLLDQGDAIAKQQKAASDDVQSVAADESKQATVKAGLDHDSQSLSAIATDFNARCNHPFVTGQEAALTACQAEQQKDLPAFLEFARHQAEYKKAMDDLGLRRKAAEQRQAEFAVQAEAWRHKLKALKLTAAIESCAAAAPSANPGDLTWLVAEYRHCWDGAPAPVGH